MDHKRAVPLSRHAIFWTIAMLGCAIDLGTKQWMFSQPSLKDGAVWWAWQGHVGLQLSLNEGALFGVGQGNVWLFAACSLVAAAAIPLWLFAWKAARDLPLTIVLGCIFGGVAGNLYDRLGLPGLDWGDFDSARRGEAVYAVRDFVLVARHWPPREGFLDVWPNFNVADSLLVCGAAALLLLSLRKPSRPVPTTANARRDEQIATG